MRTLEEKQKYHKEWIEKNKDRVKQYYKKYNDKSKEKAKDYYLKNKEAILVKNKQRLEDKYEQRLLSSCKKSAKTKQLDFNLELSDIVIPEYCPYLGIKITNTLGEGRIWSNASVDRINPTKGYVKGNIEIISLKANTMKQNATAEELIFFSKTILARHDITG